MTKLKVSVTVDPDRLAAARQVAGTDRTVSEVFDLALQGYVEHVLERRWLDAHPTDSGSDRDLPGEVPVDLSHIPWDDEPA